MAEIATVGPAPKVMAPGGRQWVRIMRACRISISGHQEQKLAVGTEVELPTHIWPSLVEAGAAVLSRPADVAPATSEDAEASLPIRQPEAATSAVEGDAEAELPEAKRRSRLVKREG